MSEIELATRELFYKMADDQLIYGHRNSEWIGLGPFLEEDISFASIAQDKVGQSRVLYMHLHNKGEGAPDMLAFARNAGQFHSCHLVELPTQQYENALIRHLLFDYAEQVRFGFLQKSTDADLAAFAQKFTGEIRYHVLHAEIMVSKLSNGGEEARTRLQAALNEYLPVAYGIFEPSPYESTLLEQGISVAESSMEAAWEQKLRTFLDSKTSLTFTQIEKAGSGGRIGRHTEHLQPLLDEMSEVFRLDPAAEW
jgi:ring-1,2-phenylacetyl-CoA epoxidase subunit PaaC